MKSRPVQFIKLAVTIGCFAAISLGCKKAPGGESMSNASSTRTSGTVPSDVTNSADGNHATPTTLTVNALPKELKGPAYSYYGLAGKSLAFQLDNRSQKINSAGSSQAVLTKVGPTSALFTIQRSGNFGDMFGNDMVRLRTNGVYDLGNSLGTLKAPVLDLPNDLHKGKTWSRNMVLTTAKGVVREHLTNKVIGKKQLSTSMGPMNVLLVEGRGTVALGKVRATTISKTYYAKGLGMVFYEETLKPKGKKAVTIFIRLASKGE